MRKSKIIKSIFFAFLFIFGLILNCLSQESKANTSSKITITFISKEDPTYVIVCRIIIFQQDGQKLIMPIYQNHITYDLEKCTGFKFEPQDGFHFSKSIPCDEKSTMVYFDVIDEGKWKKMKEAEAKRAVFAKKEVENDKIAKIGQTKQLPISKIAQN